MRQVTPSAAVILAPNPGPMTLEGTNTWVLRAPGEDRSLVVDPGPLHEGHLQALAAQGPVEQVLLTHGHLDHSEGAARLRALTGAPDVAAALAAPREVRPVLPSFGLDADDETVVFRLPGS